MKKKVFCLVMTMVLSLTVLDLPALAAEDGRAVVYQDDAMTSPAVITTDISSAVINLIATDTNKKLPAAVTIKMGEKNLATDTYTYDQKMGTVTIDTQIKDNIVTSSAYSVIMSIICDGKTTKETIATVEAGAAFACKLKAPNGFVLPETITVKVDGVVLKMDEETTYSYDSQTGKIEFTEGAITGEVSISVRCKKGTLIVGNVILYRHGSDPSNEIDGISFDPATQTLTLENASIQKSYKTGYGIEYGIYTDMDHLTIVLKGDNVLSMPTPVENRTYGIYTEGDLSIVSADPNNPGKLTIEAANINRDKKALATCGIYVSMARKAVLIDHVVLEVCAGTANSEVGGVISYGVCVDDCTEDYDGIRIQNSTVIVSGGNVTAADGAHSAGLYARDYDKSNTVITNSAVKINSADAVGTGNVSSYGISTGGGIQILEGSQVESVAGMAESNTGTAFCYGVYSEAKVSVRDAKLTACGGTVRFSGKDKGASTGICTNGLELTNADFKTMGYDTALVGYRGLQLGKEPWYQWTNAVDKAYVLSREQPFKRVDDVTYLHILPVADTPDEKQPGDDASAEEQFPDVHLVKHWATEAIDEMVQRKLFTGYQDGTFKPDAPATQCQIITILWRMEGVPTFGPEKNGTFADVPEDTWYTEAVEWAVAAGITDGKGNGTFGPDDEITREQLIAILYRYEQYKGGGFTGMWMFLLDFKDRAEVSEWAYEAMCWMTMNKVINGRADGILDPKGLSTRAEVAQVLTNYLKLKG